MEKVKVNKEKFEALESYLEINKGINLKDFTQNLMFCVINKKFTHKRKILNELTAFEMAEIIIKGYELELKKEEILLEFYKDNLYYENNNITYAIKKTLDILNIKIKGINE